MKFLLPFAVATGLGGCASVPLSPEAAAVRLVSVPSAAVAFYPPKLLVIDGRLTLDGHVFRKYSARTTAKSHLDIALLDASGQILMSETVSFVPRELRAKTSRTMAQPGHYTLPIPELPAGTAKIEVRAHDGPHSPNPESPAIHRSKSP